MLMRLVVGVCCFDRSCPELLWNYPDRFRLHFVHSGSLVCKISIFFFVFTLHVVELMELVVVGGALRGKRGLRYRFSGNGERGRGTLRVSLDKFANWVIN